MKSRTAILTVICLLGSITVVSLLAGLSYQVKNTQGSFLRSFRSHTANITREIDLSLNSYYLAGCTNNWVYLGNYTAPLYTLMFNLSTGDSVYATLDVEGISNQKFWSLRLEVDSPYFYMHDGAVPRIYRGDVTNWRAKRYTYDTEYFMDLEPMGTDRFAVRSLTGKDNLTTLGRISSWKPNFTFKRDLLSKQVDGFFCIEGYLQYEPKQSRLVYVYRYRNEFIVTDTLLQKLYGANTIDTNSVAKIEVATIRSSQANVFKTPPLVVNDLSAVSQNYLFVKSMLVATNQSPTAHDNASSIDVYDLADGHYVFSFYIFDYDGKEKLREMKVIGNKLIALFKTHLQVFELNQHDFEKPLI